MKFTRNILVPALAVALGTGVAWAQSASSSSDMAPGKPPAAYSSPSGAAEGATSGSTSSTDTGSAMTVAPGGSSSTSTGPDTSYQGATSDRSDRATAPNSAPSDRLPASRGSNGDTLSAKGGATPGANGQTSGTATNPSDDSHSGARTSSSTPDQQRPVEIYKRETTVLMVPNHPDMNTTTPGSTPPSDNSAAPSAQPDASSPTPPRTTSGMTN